MPNSIPLRRARLALLILAWVAGAAAVCFGVVAGARPIFKHNEATIFAYDLVDDIPFFIPGVGGIGLVGLIVAYLVGGTWKMPTAIVATGFVIGALCLVVGQILFLPWVAK